MGQIFGRLKLFICVGLLGFKLLVLADPKKKH